MKKPIIIALCIALFGVCKAFAGENDDQLIFTFGNKEYRQAILEKDLAKTPKWDIEKSKKCPLSFAKAILAARKELGKSVSKETTKWKVCSVNLQKALDKKHWYYIIAFQSPDGWDSIQIAVFFNGKVPPIKEM